MPASTITVRLFHQDDNQPRAPGLNPLQVDEFTAAWKHTLPKRLASAKETAERRSGKVVSVNVGPGDIYIATYTTERVRIPGTRTTSPRETPLPSTRRQVL